MPMPITCIPLDIPEVLLLEPAVFADDRGRFCETYKRSDFQEIGIEDLFIQDNESESARGVLRGLHYQLAPHAQSKLVRVVVGNVFDVAVDIRRGSSTFGQWVGQELSAENHRMIYVPPGFAHGFVTMSERAIFSYKCGAEYNKSAESGIRWDDADLAIDWPEMEMVLSEKDAALPAFSDAEVFP